MSRMISARVPDALYEQGSIQLEELGASTSELVHAAFEYLLQEHQLPKPTKRVSEKKRVLAKDAKKRLKMMFDACTLNVAVPNDIASDKQLVREARGAKYEALD